MISKLFKLLAGIDKDRWMHFTMGVIIAATVFAFFALIFGFSWGLALSVVLVVAAGFWKEWWDRRNDGTSDVIDFIEGCFGGSFVWAVALIIKIWLI